MRNVCCEVFYAETRQMVCRTNKKRTHTFIAKSQSILYGEFDPGSE